MDLLPLRLHPGDDLRTALEHAVATHHLGGAFVVSGIGSLRDARLRFAGDDQATMIDGASEILTLSGCVAENGAHLHMSIATATGQVVGGHVVPGNQVRTTAEVLLIGLPNWRLRRAPDAATGFAELTVQACQSV